MLEYAPIGLPIKLFLGSKPILKTAVWVPVLFGFAGFVMSAIVLILDEILQTKDNLRSPSWPKTLYGISAFSAQYYLSGLLDYSSVEGVWIHSILALLAAVGFAVFDGSIAGFLLGLATAVSGPVAELLLINIPHLYRYTHADFYGICSWIPWVYFLGAPAVGNLARRLYADSKTRK